MNPISYAIDKQIKLEIQRTEAFLRASQNPRQPLNLLFLKIELFFTVYTSQSYLNKKIVSPDDINRSEAFSISILHYLSQKSSGKTTNETKTFF